MKKKNYFIWIIFIICLLLFLIIMKDVIIKEDMSIDSIGYNLISKYLINDSLTPFIKAITWFGGALSLISITILLLILIKNKKIGLLIGINLILITILNQALKFIIKRPRPIDHRIIEETGFSFPSGHSMASMAFYGFMIYLIYKYTKNKYLKIVLISILSLLILMIGISRIYLGVHYTSDVLGGFLISFAYLIIYIKLTNKLIIQNK